MRKYKPDLFELFYDISMIEEVLKISKSKWRHIPNILTILRLDCNTYMVYYMLRRNGLLV